LHFLAKESQDKNFKISFAPSAIKVVGRRELIGVLHHVTVLNRWCLDINVSVSF